jgi:thioredoxin 1
MINLLVGGSLGALLGRFGQCSSGACPLTANWKRGAIYGAALGLAFYFVSGGAGGAYEPPKNIKAITETNFNAEVTQAGKSVVLDFFATWCGPCKMLAPRLDKLAGEFGGQIKFVSVNLDQSPALATQLNVQAIPTLIFFGKDGKVADTSVGLVSEEELLAKLTALTGTQNKIPGRTANEN